jgi:uncharacterized RmlC-like cupin family protein
MKRLRWVLVFAAAILIGAAVFHFGSANNAGPAAVGLVPGDIAWNTDPKLHGLETAVLIGCPSASAPYVQRIRIPANRKLAPHSHPNKARMVTVLSGTLYFAYGNKFDETKLKEFPAGSFFTEPKDMPHYAMTKDGEVILQLDAIGPDGTVYVK